MKKHVVYLLLCLVLIAACSSVVAPAVAESPDVQAVEIQAENKQEARFLNMLNHNFVYNEAFDCVDDVVNNSVLALLDLRDSEDEDFIKAAYVKGFVNDMYGIEIADMSGLNEGFPKKDGCVYIIPRGFTSYTHDIISIDENEDGSFTVVSEVLSDSHDDSTERQKAVSLFVKNDASAFGYNIIFCNIVENASDI